MKKIIKILLIISILSISRLTYANSIDFYGNKDSSWDIISNSNINKISNELENFYKTTGLNTDIVILGKQDECYLETNFDSCVQEKKGYSSDLIIVLSMKSDIKNKGDIRSLIKDEFKEVITPYDLKNIQDYIISDFKESNFTGGMINYLSYLQDFINEKCLEVGLDESCNTTNLSKKYHSFIAEKEYEKKYNAMMKIFYYLLLILLIIITYYITKKYYKKSIHNLYKDIDYKITNIGDYNIFKKDRTKILTELDGLKILVKNKLGDLDKNIFNLRKFYKYNKKQFNIIEDNISKMQESFSKKEELKERVEKMKKIDL